MKDPDGVEQDLLCSIADMEKKKEEGWIMVFHPPKNNLIGHTGDILSHTSEDWNSVLKNIKSKHPGSTLQTKY